MSLTPNWTSQNSSWCGDPKRGAAMGRVSTHGPSKGHKFTLKHIKLDSGGYDAGGAYWGLGEKLYWAASDDGSVDYYFRLYESDVAKVLPRDDKFCELYWGDIGNDIARDRKAARKHNPVMYRFMKTKNTDRFKAKLLVLDKYPGSTFHN